MMCLLEALKVMKVCSIRGSDGGGCILSRNDGGASSD